MTKWIAHRGVSSVAPENTMAAFTLAWAHDVDGIECDVQVSKDQVVIVHHDYDTNRCGDVAHVIADSDYTLLKTIDIGSFKAEHYGSERIPTLAQVLQAMPTGKTIQVEIKPDVDNLAPIIVELQTARQDIDLIVMSFNANSLQQVGSECANAKTLWILDEGDARQSDVFAQAKAFGFDGIDVNYRVIDKSYIKRAHEHQLLLGAWTVNTFAQAQQLIEWGIDMLASDYTPTLFEQTHGHLKTRME